MSAEADGTTEENRTATAPAEGIENFGDMDAIQTSVHEFTVLNMRPGDDPDSLRAYQVNVHDRSCTCPHGKMNEDDQIPCKHLAYVVARTPLKVDISDTLVHDVGNVVRDVRDAAQQTMTAAEAMSNGQSNQSAGDSSGSSGGSSDDSNDDDSPPVETDGVGASDAQAQLVMEVEDWIESATQFNSDIDPSIANVEWGKFVGDDGPTGEEGVHIDMAPWYGDGYYDSGDNQWTDKDGYDESREALSDLLSNQDEIVYTGDPHYANFLPEGDVTEVLG